MYNHQFDNTGPRYLESILPRIPPLACFVLPCRMRLREESCRERLLMFARSRLGPATISTLTALAVGVLADCAAPPGTLAPSGPQAETSSFKLQTNAFKPGGDLPRKFTCEGADASPGLDWSESPASTQSFALIVDDPDAPGGTWVHWAVYDLPSSARQLPEGVPQADDLPGGGRQGVNDFGKPGYGGPCPPPGKPHRYFFKLYALDKRLDLGAAATKKAVEQAMKGHILAQAELVGRYGH